MQQEHELFMTVIGPNGKIVVRTVYNGIRKDQDVQQEHELFMTVIGPNGEIMVRDRQGEVVATFNPDLTAKGEFNEEPKENEIGKSQDIGDEGE